MERSRQLELPFPGSAPALRSRVHELTRTLVARARRRWPEADLPPVRVEFRLRGRSAGEACVESNTTNYNAELLERYGEAFLREIVPHEIAHLVVERIHPGPRRPHGPEWRAVMDFFGAPPRATHAFAALPVPEAGRFPYRCACPEPHWLTRRAHQKVRRGSQELSCRVCGRRLVYAGGRARTRDLTRGARRGASRS